MLGESINKLRESRDLVLDSGERADMYTAWTYPENVSKKADYLDISLFLPTEQVQELWIEKNAFPASFD